MDQFSTTPPLQVVGQRERLPITGGGTGGGTGVGSGVGASVGSRVGASVGSRVGARLAEADGSLDGSAETDGTGVGVPPFPTATYSSRAPAAAAKTSAVGTTAGAPGGGAGGGEPVARVMGEPAIRPRREVGGAGAVAGSGQVALEVCETICEALVRWHRSSPWHRCRRRRGRGGRGAPPPARPRPRRCTNPKMRGR